MAEVVRHFIQVEKTSSQVLKDDAEAKKLELFKGKKLQSRFSRAEKA